MQDPIRDMMKERNQGLILPVARIQEQTWIQILIVILIPMQTALPEAVT